MDLLSNPEVIRQLVVGMISLILSIAVHEFGHAFVADRLGDSLPRYQGRVTLNPLVHADPVGTYLLPIGGFVLSAMSGYGAHIGFGWGKPVQINPAALSRRFRMKVGHMMVALAGPMMNFLVGTLVLGITLAVAHAGLIRSWELANALLSLIILNYTLMFFNLVPVPPLDGSAVIVGFTPRSVAHLMDKLTPYSFMILAALMFTPASKIFLWPAQKMFYFGADVTGLWPALAHSLRGVQ